MQQREQSRVTAQHIASVASTRVETARDQVADTEVAPREAGRSWCEDYEGPSVLVRDTSPRYDDEQGVETTLSRLLDVGSLMTDGVLFVDEESTTKDDLPDYLAFKSGGTDTRELAWQLAGRVLSTVESTLRDGVEDEAQVLRDLDSSLHKAVIVLHAIESGTRLQQVEGSLRLDTASTDAAYCSFLIDVAEQVKGELIDIADRQLVDMDVDAGASHEPCATRLRGRREAVRAAPPPQPTVVPSRPPSAILVKEAREKRGYKPASYKLASKCEESELDKRFDHTDAFLVSVALSTTLADAATLAALRAVGVEVSDAEVASAQSQLLARAASIASGESGSSNCAEEFFVLADRVLRGAAAALCAAGDGEGGVLHEANLETLCAQQSIVGLLRVLYSRELPAHVDRTDIADSVIRMSYDDLVCDTESGGSEVTPVQHARSSWERGSEDVRRGMMHLAGSSLVSGLAGYKLLLLSGHAVCKPATAPVPNFAFRNNESGEAGEGLAFLCAAVVCHLVGDRSEAEWAKVLARRVEEKMLIASNVQRSVAKLFEELLDKPLYSEDCRDCFMAELMHGEVFLSGYEAPSAMSLKQSFGLFLEGLSTSSRGPGSLSLAVNGFCYDVTEKLFSALRHDASGVVPALASKLNALRAKLRERKWWNEGGPARSFTYPANKVSASISAYIGPSFLSNTCKMGREHDAVPRLACDVRDTASRVAVALVAKYFQKEPFHDRVELPGAESKSRSVVVLPAALYLIGVAQRRKPEQLRSLLQAVVSNLSVESDSTRGDDAYRLFMRMWMPRLLQLHAEGGIAVLLAARPLLQKCERGLVPGVDWALDSYDFDVILRDVAARLVPRQGGPLACGLTDLRAEVDAAAVIGSNMRHMAILVCGERPRGKRTIADSEAEQPCLLGFCSAVRTAIEVVQADADNAAQAEVVNTIKRQRTHACQVWKGVCPRSKGAPATAFSLF